MLVFAFLLEAINLCGCTRNKKPKRKVVVFVLDSFIEEESHGELVADIIEEKSLSKCEIKIIDVFFSIGAKKNKYLKALADVSDYADKHPNEAIVVNISLCSKNYNLLEHLMISELYEKGVIVVAAAGNDATSNRRYPAAYRETIAVAALHWKRKADYSNYGSHIDLATSGFGSEKLLKKETSGGGLFIEETKYYSVRGGTSFATPRVAGLIAYLLRQRPELSPREIVHLVKENATPVKDKFGRCGLLGARINPYGTIFAVDPVYQRALVFQIASIVAVLIFWIFCDRFFDANGGLFFTGLLLFGLLLIAANIILIQAWNIIYGTIAGSTLILLAGLCLPMMYSFNKKKKEKEKMERLGEFET